MSAAVDPEFAKLAAEAAQDPSFQAAAGKAVSAGSDSERFWSDVARFAPISAAAMLSRILLSDERIGWLNALCKVFASGVVGCLAGWIAQDYIASSNLRYALVGIAGWFADKLMDYAGKLIDAKAKAKIAQAKAEAPRPKTKRRKKGRK